MKESSIEKYVRTHLPEGYLLKWVSPGESGVPDRLLVYKGQLTPIEFKKPGGSLSPRQILWINRFIDLGVPVLVIGSMREAQQFMFELVKEEIVPWKSSFRIRTRLE